MHSSFDAIIIGAGPIGCTVAAVLSATNKNVRICVLDGRPDPTRNHGLKISKDSIDEIQAVLQRALKENSSVCDQQKIDKVNQLFANWKQIGFVRTTEIELRLKDLLTEMGVTIRRDKAFKLQEAQLDHLLSIAPTSATEDELSNAEFLEKVITHAPIIVGCDGAHSVVRKAVMGEKRVDESGQTVYQDCLSSEEHYLYLIENKYQIDGKAEKFSKKAILSNASINGNIEFDAVSGRPVEGYKPATQHIVVDKETFDLLMYETTKDGEKIPRNAQYPWTLKELDGLDKQPKIQHICSIIRRHLNQADNWKDEKITTLELKSFISRESIKMHGHHIVALAGDAHSGMVLERGVNKGFKEAAHLAQAISHTLLEGKGKEAVIPHHFTKYQEQARNLFAEENRAASFKKFWIQIAEKIVKIISLLFFTPYDRIKKMFVQQTFDTINHSSSSSLSFFERYVIHTLSD